MTQAHKTPGAIVVLKDEWINTDPRFAPPCSLDEIFEVIKEEPKGHLHVRSMRDPSIQLNGWHADRFKTYKGDLR